MNVVIADLAGSDGATVAALQKLISEQPGCEAPSGAAQLEHRLRPDEIADSRQTSRVILVEALGVRMGRWHRRNDQLQKHPTAQHQRTAQPTTDPR